MVKEANASATSNPLTFVGDDTYKKASLVLEAKSSSFSTL